MPAAMASTMAACFTLPPNRCHRLLFQGGAASNIPKYRVSPAVVINAAVIRPGGAVESDKLCSDVRKLAMEAVDACGRRVTVGDVAGRAGLKLFEAQKALQALAADTRGFLEVSDEGDVLYVFPKDYREKLVGKSFIMRIEPLLEKAKAKAEYLAKVSFGIALITSNILVFAAILVALVTIILNDDSGTCLTSSYSSGGSSFWLNFDFPSTSRWNEVKGVEPQEKQQTDTAPLKFGESFFSFVFGDGDPNQGLEEKRWKMIGQYISSKGGVVAAEELAPYLDIETSGENLTDEAYILPVLLQYDGQPLIDEEGNILYQFPSLQRTASRKTRIWPEVVGQTYKYLTEERWQFSKTSISKRAMVVGLGGLNLYGIIILRGLLKHPTVAQLCFIKFITIIFPLLQIYAGSFFLIPLLRWFVLLKTNADIEKRNQTRQQFAQDIELPDPSLRQKLLSAREMAQRTVIGKDKIVYSSGKDLVEQELDRRFQQI